MVGIAQFDGTTSYYKQNKTNKRFPPSPTHIYLEQAKHANQHNQPTQKQNSDAFEPLQILKHNNPLYENSLFDPNLPTGASAYPHGQFTVNTLSGSGMFENIGVSPPSFLLPLPYPTQPCPPPSSFLPPLSTPSHSSSPLPPPHSSPNTHAHQGTHGNVDITASTTKRVIAIHFPQKKHTKYNQHNKQAYGDGYSGDNAYGDGYHN